jgi:DNA sulfur modification protein DndD
MIKAEYLRFLQTLNNTTIPEPVRKIANLVASHFDELVPLSTNQGQRIKKVVSLSQKEWATLSPNIAPLVVGPAEKLVKISQLSRIEIGPFRGFEKKEDFDLASPLVLIYGPNGTGKSSFCEALEYGLLGNVAEADNKRFRDQNDYLKNAHVDKFSAPIIYAIDDQSNEVRVTPNEAAYRFCFVEKNRIDSFSRIAAQAPAKQSELISTLFGLEAFNEFVNNFTDDIDDKYIDKVGQKALLLSQKRQGLSGAQQQIQSNTSELQTIAADEIKLSTQYKAGMSFSELILELYGTNEAPGQIGLIENELQQPLGIKSNLVKSSLDQYGTNIATNTTLLSSKQQELASASLQISFKNLYEAVTNLQTSSPNACPACKTPLTQTALNPYLNASEELKKLEQLAALQSQVRQLEQTIKDHTFQVSQMLNTCLRFYPQNNPLQPFVITNNAQPTAQWWASLLVQLPDGYQPWQHLVSQVLQLELNDNQLDQLAGIRVGKQAQLVNLREYARQVTVLQTRRETANTTISASQLLIDNFNTQNAQLILDVEAEKSVVLTNQQICTAYATFVNKLESYTNSLPAQLVADLGELIVELYNAFNRNDAENELLATVKLPLAQNQRLKIAFKNDTSKFHDALHILSEGHIRCLGLAILLAKNLKEDAPILIFDDPVNAIDDDHRESIRRALFQDHYFLKKQIMLTCHGEEFFKDIQNLLSAEAASQIRSFSFLPKLGDTHVRVDFNSPPRNYLISAREHIGRGEVRDALAKARQALEGLTKDKIWRYVTKHGDGNLSLKLRTASSPIELRNLTEQLKSKIGKSDFTDANKEKVLDPLNLLLGPNGESREWRYLNKGTHEESERPEFDRASVLNIINNLEFLDAALS